MMKCTHIEKFRDSKVYQVRSFERYYKHALENHKSTTKLTDCRATALWPNLWGVNPCSKKYWSPRPTPHSPTTPRTRMSYARHVPNGRCDWLIKTIQDNKTI